MTVYSVYERRDDAPLAVADRFSWSAALLPPVHALVHGLWLMLAVWVVVTAAIAGLGLWVGGEAAFWLYVAFALGLGFEASGFRRARAGKGGGYSGEIVAGAEDLAVVEYLKRQRR